MGLARQDAPLLKRRLDGLLELYGPAYIDTDPIGMVHAFEKREDREVAAFFAAALAFGRVASIRASLSRIFERLGESPRDRLLRFESRKEKCICLILCILQRTSFFILACCQADFGKVVS